TTSITSLKLDLASSSFSNMPLYINGSCIRVSIFYVRTNGFRVKESKLSEFSNGSYYLFFIPFLSWTCSKLSVNNFIVCFFVTNNRNVVEISDRPFCNTDFEINSVVFCSHLNGIDSREQITIVVIKTGYVIRIGLGVVFNTFLEHYSVVFITFINSQMPS